MAKDRVLIVGAGLAGLGCALELHQKHIPFQILEASDGVGGRVRTDEFEGFLLDRGFQVHLTAYPEGVRMLDYAALDLRSFAPGAIVRVASSFSKIADPWCVGGRALATLFSDVGSLVDKLKMRTLRNRMQSSSIEDILARDNHSTLGLLKIDGFSPVMIDRFFRPFMGAITLESSLVQSSRMFEFVFKMMSDGDSVVPARGMGEIPKQIAARLPQDTIRLNSRVASLRESGVTLESGEQLDGACVVLACEGTEACRLLPALPSYRWRGVSCLYFEAPAPPVEGSWIVLNGNGQWPTNNLAVMSEISPAYAPAGKSLVSVSALGRRSATDAELKSSILTQMERWYGRDVRAWKHLRTYRIPNAQPDLTPQPLEERPPRFGNGVYIAGDHWTMPSIHFALLSGRRAADAVVSDLAGQPAPLAA